MGDLDWVDDAVIDEVAVLEGIGVEALTVGHLGNAGNDDGAVEASVFGDPERRAGQGAGDGENADLSLALEALGEGLEFLGNLDQHGAAAGDDTLFDGRAGRVDGVFNTQLALVYLGLGSGADADNGHAAGELSQALLELFLIPGGIGALDLATDLLAAFLYCLSGAAAIDDDGVILGDGHAASGTEHVEASLVEVDAHLWVDDGGTGNDGQVIHESLAALAKVRGLNGSDLEHLADGVDDERLQRLALDVFRNDEGRAVGLGDLLQQRQEVRQGGDLVADEQYCGVVQHGVVGLFFRSEVRGKVALIKGNAFGDIDGGVDSLGFLDGDNAVLAHLVHGTGNHLADLRVAGGDGSYLRDFRGGVDRGGAGLELLDGLFGRCCDAAVKLDWVGAGRDVAQAFEDERLGQQGSGGGAVTCGVISLDSNGLDQLRAEVFEGLLDVDIAGDGHAVIGDGGATEGLGQHDVAAARAEGDLDGISQRIDAALDSLAGFLVECNELCHKWAYFSMTASRSREDSSRYSSPLYFSSVPPYLEKTTVSPSLTPTGVASPLSLVRPGPTATTVASCGFSLAESGMTRPEAVVVSASTICTRTRSSRGLMFAMMFPP